jgi:hypothetical protein
MASVKADGPETARQSRSAVAIVTPQHRFPLSGDEQISLRHLREYLGRFDRYIIGPQSLPREFSDFGLRPFPSHYFASSLGYNHLLISQQFYRAFADYEYVLIYQLDSLVFSSNLEEWCGKGWDYVGAPWFRNYLDDPNAGLWAVGNGGFSLRKIDTALAVLTSSKRLLDDPKKRATATDRFSFAPPLRRVSVALKTLLFERGYHNTPRWLMREFLRNPDSHEDAFWAFSARKLMEDFRIPGVAEALKFSFEMAPRYCFRENLDRLPFGCHAWAKYDREFWEPFLLK